MKILTFSDLHGVPSDDEMRRILPHCDCAFCVSLGDNPQEALTKIKKYARGLLYGIAGNHDEWNTPENAGFTDIHGKNFQIICCDPAHEYGANESILFAGFGGSHRYKKSSPAMLMQEESIGFAKNMPPCDILLSHDSMYGELGDVNDAAHCGLKGI